MHAPGAPVPAYCLAFAGIWPKEISPRGRAGGLTCSRKMATCESTLRETSLPWAANASRRQAI